MELRSAAHQTCARSLSCTFSPNICTFLRLFEEMLGGDSRVCLQLVVGFFSVFLIVAFFKPSVVAHTFNLCIQKAEEGGSL